MGSPALLEEVDEAVDGKLAGVEGVAGVQPPTEQVVADVQLGRRRRLPTKSVQI